jgi:hypothetical protein
MGIVAVLTKDRNTIHNDIYICIIIYIMLPALYECHVQEHTRTALVCSFCSWRTNHEIYGIDLPLGRGQKELPSGNQTLQRRSHHLVRLISHWNTSKPFICRRCSIILPWFYDPPRFPMLFPWFSHDFRLFIGDFPATGCRVVFSGHAPRAIPRSLAMDPGLKPMDFVYTFDIDIWSTYFPNMHIYIYIYLEIERER